MIHEPPVTVPCERWYEIPAAAFMVLYCQGVTRLSWIPQIQESTTLYGTACISTRLFIWTVRRLGFNLCPWHCGTEIKSYSRWRILKATLNVWEAVLNSCLLENLVFNDQVLHLQKNPGISRFLESHSWLEMLWELMRLYDWRIITQACFSQMCGFSYSRRDGFLFMVLLALS